MVDGKSLNWERSKIADAQKKTIKIDRNRGDTKGGKCGR